MLRSAERMPEREPAFKKTINFFEISPEQEERLRLLIAENKGRIRVFVHPFYQKSLLVKEGLFRLLEKIQAAPPIFIMEESPSIRTTELTLEILDIPAESVYMIPTELDSPEPLYDDKEKHSDKRYGKNWQKLNSQLKELGVKTVLVGGMNFTPNEGDAHTAQCVGGALTAFGRDFQTQLSNFTYPAGRTKVSRLKNTKYKQHL